MKGLMVTKKTVNRLPPSNIKDNALVPTPNVGRNFVQKKQDANFIATHPVSKMSNGVGWGGEVPSYKKGGTVKKTGLALVHKGEKVIPVKDKKDSKTEKMESKKEMMSEVEPKKKFKYGMQKK